VLISHGFDGFDAQGTISHDLEQKLVQVIQQLESVGATHIGVACNTAHACLDAMRQACNLPIANLPEETAKQAAKQPGNYLLITSHAAREAELYPTAMKAAGVDFTELSDEDQKIADEVIGLVMAYRLPEAGQKIAELVAPHLHKVDGVIAGCTELPIAFDFSGNIVKDKLYVDSNQVLAQALADQCYTRAAVAV